MVQNSGKACCRLCLAPENECVGIFKTQAADKQQIQAKINLCVQIQVSQINSKSSANQIFRKRRSVSFTDSPYKRSSLCAGKIDKCQCGWSHASEGSRNEKKKKKNVWC